VSENHGDQSAAPTSCKNEDMLLLRTKMIVAPVNSAHTGISATNALTAASFIASPAHQQIHDPVTEIEPIHAIMFIVTSSGALLALRWRPRLALQSAAHAERNRALSSAECKKPCDNMISAWCSRGLTSRGRRFAMRRIFYR
jgi:hypothetical protein